MGELETSTPSSGHLTTIYQEAATAVAPSEDDHAAKDASTLGETSVSQGGALSFLQIISVSGVTLILAQLTQQADKHL